MSLKEAEKLVGKKYVRKRSVGTSYKDAK